MRKPKYEFGNVGKQTLGTKRDAKRCNACDFCNGINGHRVMHKDPQDKYGGYLCSECHGAVYRPGSLSKFEKQEQSSEVGSKPINRKDLVWHDDEVHNGIVHSVDNPKSFDEIIEDYISEIDD